jgi:hypothetical protein
MPTAGRCKVVSGQRAYTLLDAEAAVVGLDAVGGVGRKG